MRKTSVLRSQSVSPPPGESVASSYMGWSGKSWRWPNTEVGLRLILAIENTFPSSTNCVWCQARDGSTDSGICCWRLFTEGLMPHWRRELSTWEEPLSNPRSLVLSLRWTIVAPARGLGLLRTGLNLRAHFSPWHICLMDSLLLLPRSKQLCIIKARLHYVDCSVPGAITMD